MVTVLYCMVKCVPPVLLEVDFRPRTEALAELNFNALVQVRCWHLSNKERKQNDVRSFSRPLSDNQLNLLNSDICPRDWAPLYQSCCAAHQLDTTRTGLQEHLSFWLGNIGDMSLTIVCFEMSNPHAAIHAEDSKYSKDLRVVAAKVCTVWSFRSIGLSIAVSSSVFNTSKRKLDKLLRENIRSTVTKFWHIDISSPVSNIEANKFI